MKIEHIALWTNDLQRVRHFYEIYFDAEPGEIYVNQSNNFSSCFLSFEDETCRLEIMQDLEVVAKTINTKNKIAGYAHLSMSVGSREMVNFKTERLRNDGYTVISEARQTGDGYYEQCGPRSGW